MASKKSNDGGLALIMSTIGIRCADTIREKLHDAGFIIDDLLNAEIAEIVDQEHLAAVRLDGQKPKAARRDENGIPPEASQVRAYCAEIGAYFDPEAFCDHYATKGWKVGKERMKDWKAAARQWKREGWGLPKYTTRPNSPANRELSEWDRKQKEDRLGGLKAQIREMRFPGGCAYAVALEGEKLQRAQVIQAEIEKLQVELKGTVADLGKG